MSVRVRFAPAPTGELHVGGARTALFNWLFARKHGGKFILRIEDTDPTTVRPEYLRAILEALNWLGLRWDEGPGVGGPFSPYFQSERHKARGYEKYLQELKEGDHIYPCYCTPGELEERRKLMLTKGIPPREVCLCGEVSEEERSRLKAEGRRPVYRFRVPEEGETCWEDVIRGKVCFKNFEIEDFVIVRSDGSPTYNFAAVVDDHEMRITHVIRGDEHISNTPRQLMLYRALGLKPPVFAHIPMILGSDRTKLSKRHGATSILAYRDMGYLPEAMVNFLALLGWSPGGDREIISVEEMIEGFSLERVSKSPAVFNAQKLEWMNGEYIRTISVEELSERAIPFIRCKGWLPEEGEVPPETREYVRKVLALVKDRLKHLGHLEDYAAFFFEEPPKYHKEALEKWLSDRETATLLEGVAGRLDALDNFDVRFIESVIRGYAAELGVKAARVIHPVRAAVTGRTVGPGLFELIEVLGKERCVRRLLKVAQLLREGKLKPEEKRGSWEKR